VANPYSAGLEQNPANYVPLSPLSFIERSAFVYPKRISIIQGARQYTWKESYDRCRQLASALINRGIGKGDTVAVMLPNTAPMFECHFGVPMTGAVLNTLNTRLDAEAIAFMLQHGEAKVLITDPEFTATVKAASGADRRPEAAGHRHHRPGIYRRRSAWRKGLRGFPERR
jgi:fatty-acyl-CoA synthase